MAGLGLASGFGAGAGAEALRDMLKQKFLEAQAEEQSALERDKFSESRRQFDAMMPLRQGDLDVARGNLSLGQDRLGEERRQFDTTAPGRAASVRLSAAQAARLEGEPEADRVAFERDMQKLGAENAFRVGQIRVSGQEDRRTRSAQPASEPLVQVQGPNGTIYVPRSQAIGMSAPSGASKPATGSERQALSFYRRADEANTTAAPLESQIANMGLAGQVGLEMLPNFLQSDLGQSYRQAQRAFTEARLRKESGAAIPQGEYDTDAKTYFAQPGDSPETIAQKQASRQTVLEGLGFSAGKAFDEYYGEPFKKGAGSKPKSDTAVDFEIVRDPKTGKLIRK